MRIKRFEAPDNKTALAMIKKEMGEDAVILATRTITPARRGAPGLVEVVAAMDYDLEEFSAPVETGKAQKAAPAAGYGYHSVRRPLSEKNTPTAPSWLTIPEENEPTPRPRAGADKISVESHDLKKRFSTLLQRQPAPRPQPVPPTAPPPTAGERGKPRPEEIAKWRDQLLENIQLREPKIEGGGRGPTIIALVGATGVGKTTTAAKLAAWFSLQDNTRVALLSMDCYRIGATDQLRTYARIMRLPCEIALRQRDLHQAIARHRDKDLLIIDTAGKSPYDEQHIAELQEWFAPCPRLEPYLVLSATTKKEDLQQVLNCYAPLTIAGLVLTKLDETRAYATLCQMVANAAIPVSYLCTGQRVPEDFMVAAKDFLDTLFKKGWAAIAPELGSKAAKLWETT